MNKAVITLFLLISLSTNGQDNLVQLLQMSIDFDTIQKHLEVQEIVN